MSYANTRFLLPGNGANGGTSFPDYSRFNHQPSAVNGAITSTAQSKFYGSSMFFDGSNDNIRYDRMQLGSGAFTVEAYVRATAFGGSGITVNAVVGTYTGGTDTTNWNFGVSSDSLQFRRGDASTITRTASIVTGAWMHVAACRDESDDLRLFLDGTQAGETAAFAGALTSLLQPLTVGALASLLTTRPWNGYIQDVRIIVGEALYTANFTPPGKLLGTLSNQGTGGEPVKDDTGTAAERTIVAVPRMYGAGGNRTFHGVSNGSGNFELSAPSSAEFSDIDGYSVIALDDAAGTDYNDLILGRVATV